MDEQEKRPETRESRQSGISIIPTEEDPRTGFHHDRDRILYLDALSRLSGVTQVVSAYEGQPFHNRLTHTHKVAQLSRRIAERLLHNEDNQTTIAELGGISADVAEAAGLAHDLGHPPFGHVAEEELDKCVRRSGNPNGFEGNAQSFRIVTTLALRKVGERGLDLTAATLRAILKYPWLRDFDEDGNPPGGDESTKHWRKFGCYRTHHSRADDLSKEHRDFQFVVGKCNEAQKSAEAEIMDWADDITYAVHDVVDFFRAGLIPLDRFGDEGDLWGEFKENAVSSYKKRTGDDLQLGGLDTLSITRLFPSGPYDGSAQALRKLVGLSSALITKFLPALSLRVPSDDNARCAVIADEDKGLVELLKQLTWVYVVERPSLASQQHGQRKVIRELFDVYCNGNEALIPRQYLDLFGTHARARIAADIIAGMTESEAVNMYARFLGTDVGSVLDPIVGR